MPLNRARPPITLKAIFIASAMAALSAPAQARHHHHSKHADKQTIPMAKVPTAEATLAAMRTDRPPRTSFEVNFVLTNSTAQPCWFLLPLALPLKTGNQISAFEEHRAETRHDLVTVGRTLGLWAFQLVLVAPQSKVKLERLPIAYWGDAPQGSVAFEVLTTAELRIGNKPAREWFTADPTLKNGIDIKGERLQLATTKRAAPGQTTVTMKDEWHIKLSLALTTK